MALDTRIIRRENGTYAFPGSVPKELRELVPGGRSGQKWIMLGTKDLDEAKRRARVKSVEFDRLLDAARRQLAGHRDTISQVERLAGIWLNWVMEED
jgi:hypothetical protein